MAKKVVALETFAIVGITEGKVYVCIDECGIYYTIINDRDEIVGVLKERFKPLEKEMEIKVGSEWVNEDGLDFTVLFIDDGECFVKWEDGKRSVVSSKLINRLCKPAPVRRTVWLNVYEGHAVSYNSKQSADLNMSNAVLFQQEVELIDPREGKKDE